MFDQKRTRKGFLVVLGMGAVGALAACSGTNSSASPTSAPASAPSTAAGATPTTASAAPTAAATQSVSAATTVPKATSAPAASSGKTITLVASSDYQAVYETVAKDFKAKTGASVNLITQAYNQTHDKIVSGVAGGANYDIVAVDTIWTAEFAAAGFISPLDDRITKSVQDKIVPAALVGRSYKDKIYQWPQFTLKLLYYNDDLLKKAGLSAPPQYLADMVTDSTTVQEKAGIKYGMGWAMSQAEGLVCDYVQMLKAFGGEYTDAKGNWILNQGGGLQALQYMVDTLYKNKVADPASLTLDDRSVRNPFNKGDYAFMFNWTSEWAQAKDPKSSQIANAVAIGLIPGVKAANVVSASCTGGSGFGLAAKSTQKDLAWQYVDMVAISEDAQRRLLKMVSSMPTYKSLYSDAAILKDYPQFAAMRKQMDYGIARPELPWYGEWTKAVQIELTNALSQKKQPKQALDDAVKAANDLAKQYA